ncbi:ParB N-terminal domain-containing protein [Alteriqipengyuania sp. 357]
MDAVTTNVSTESNTKMGDKDENRVFIERIGTHEFELIETQLDVDSEVRLWDANPRIMPDLPTQGISSEDDLMAALRASTGYDTLKKSISDLGQMEPIYVKKVGDKYLVYEGATRLTILRELHSKTVGGVDEGKFKNVRVRVLPPEFGDQELAILLARIHVRGPNVRQWGRYTQAKFMYDTIVGIAGKPAVMNQAQMARFMEKSESWVNRLKSAYEFARHFIDYVDAEDIDGEPTEKFVVKRFSILEEISKATVIGPKLRDYDNAKYDSLREEVFEMVKNDVFKEYRDARFIKEFHEDADAWDQLKSGEKHIAHDLAREMNAKERGARSKVAAIPALVKRAIERDDTEFEEEDIASLQEAISEMQTQVHQGVKPFRVELRRMTETLNEASKSDIEALEAEEVENFAEAYEWFTQLTEKYGNA